MNKQARAREGRALRACTPVLSEIILRVRGKSFYRTTPGAATQCEPTGTGCHGTCISGAFGTVGLTGGRKTLVELIAMIA